MKFLKTLLAVILGFFISIGIMFTLIIIMISAFASAFGNDTKQPKVENNSILVIDFDKPLKDYGDKTIFKDFDLTIENFNALNQILPALEKAKTDDRIKGISIKSSGMLNGMAQIKELRDAIADFKQSGKFVYAYNDVVPQAEYYLQSVADSVFVNPVGDIEFKGLSSEILYFKGFQEKTGAKMEVIRHGKYKSAVEPFISETMSDANRLQITELLTSLWNTVKKDISESRGISVEELNTIADNLAARTPEKALSNRIIDGLMYQNDFDNLLVKATQSESIDDINFITIADYAESVNDKAVLDKPKDKIAILYAEGEIIYGNGIEGTFGQININEALREIRKDENVKAIVLRVNSPGGSALASELIHHEIELTQQTIPVYVSMGNYAASGGYYISCNAKRIFADANTITGSIGVFGMLPNVKELADKWGINAEQVSTNKRAEGYSLFEKPSDDFIETTTESIENIYDIFLKRVAEGRNMTVEKVNEIAQGRVWSGTQALENGLVDEIGNLKKAIEYAATEQNLTEYAIQNYPVRNTSVEEIMKRFGLISIKERFIKDEIGEQNYQTIQKLKNIFNQKGIQARLPFELQIR